MSDSCSSSDDETYAEEDENNAYEIVFLLPQTARFDINTKSNCTLIQLEVKTLNEIRRDYTELLGTLLTQAHNNLLTLLKKNM